MKISSYLARIAPQQTHTEIICRGFDNRNYICIELLQKNVRTSKQNLQGLALETTSGTRRKLGDLAPRRRTHLDLRLVDHHHRAHRRGSRRLATGVPRTLCSR
jgi:hypothetical protein